LLARAVAEIAEENKRNCGRLSTENSEEPFFLVAAGGAVLVVCFFANFFYFFLPSFAFSSLQQPSFAFIGEGSERGFGGGFGRPTRAAWAGWSRVTVWRSADFQICRVAGFQTRRPQGRGAGLEAGDTAGWETCATQPRQVRAQQIRSRLGPAGGGIDRAYVSHA
jgi:hypothetical protein